MAWLPSSEPRHSGWAVQAVACLGFAPPRADPSACSPLRTRLRWPALSERRFAFDIWIPCRFVDVRCRCGTSRRDGAGRLEQCPHNGGEIRAAHPAAGRVDIETVSDTSN